MIILALVVLLSIVLLANVGLYERWARDAMHLLVAALNSALAVFSAWLLIAADRPLPPGLVDPLFVASLQRAARDASLAGLATALLASLLLLRPLRRGLVRVLERVRVGHLDPDSPVHTAALVLCIYLLAGMLLEWLVAGDVGGLAELSGPVLIGDVLFSGVLAVAFALMGVGLGVRRSWAETLERLGVTPPNVQNVLGGVGGAGAMLTFMIVFSALWFLLAPNSLGELNSAADVLFGGFASLPAALVVAVSTAVGEELLFRGALQPRLGLLPTSLLFAVLHVQYTLSPASLMILGIGLALGLLRWRLDTTASMVAHFLYNFSLLALAAALPQG